MPSGLVGDFSEEAVELTGVGLGQNAAFAQLRSSSQPRTPRLYECVVPEDGEDRICMHAVRPSPMWPAGRWPMSRVVTRRPT